MTRRAAATVLSVADVAGIEYLADISPRDRPWDRHRHEAEQVARHLEQSHYPHLRKWATRMDECATFTEFGWAPDRYAGPGVLTQKLKRANFCRVRVCPVCQWRRSLSWTARMFSALPEVEEQHPDHRWLSLTLTVRNVELDQLKKTLQHLNKSFVRLTHRKRWPAVGWIRSTEITRGKDNSAHPHLHVLMLVDGSYFDRGRDDYLSFEEWIQLWRSCARLDYDPSIDIQAVKATTIGGDQRDLQKAIVETLKYAVKPADMIDDGDWLCEMSQQIHGTRSIGVGGVLRDHLREEEPEDGEMLLAGENDDGEINTGGMVYIWRGDASGSPRYARSLPRPPPNPGASSISRLTLYS